MINIVDSFFDYISKNYFLSIVFFFSILYVICKLMDLLKIDSFFKKISFVKDSNKAVYFSLISIGIFFIIMGFIINLFSEYPRIWFIIASGLLLGGLLGFVPFSFIEKPIRSKPRRKRGMKCDAKKIGQPKGGFSCSILGDTVGADWVWEESPYKEKILNSPECDADFIRKKGFFGEKCFFSCWIMGKFKVKHNAKDLESKVKAMR